MGRKSVIAGILVGLGLFMIGLLIAQGAPRVGPATAVESAARTLKVKGQGVVYATPDEVAISLAVRTNRKEATQALSANNRAMQSVMKALSSLGLGEKEVQTSDVSLYPQEEWVRGSSRVIGYTASNTVVVKTKRLDMAGKILDTANKAGSNQINSIVFQLSESSVARQEALKKAFQAAKGKAEALSGEMKLSLVRIGKVVEADAMSYEPLRAYDAMKSLNSESTPINPADVAVRANIEVTYEID